ncbi:MAG TPA: DUF5982 domain-containing protein [Cytophagaceae bacterium]|nr:DUF5982 domain-containing protein [Cytophagaceae bacterium]
MAGLCLAQEPGNEKKLPFKIDEEKELSEMDIENKKEGWYPTGVPLFTSDPIEGLGFGAKGYLYNNGKKSDPFFPYTTYRTKVSLQVFYTTKNEREVELNFDIPYIFNSRWRIRGGGFYERDPNLLYFGIGESSLNPLSYYVNNDTTQQFVTNARYNQREKNLSYRRKGRSGEAATVTDAKYNGYDFEAGVFNLSAERTYMEGRLRVVGGMEISKTRVYDFYNKEVEGVDPLTGQKLKTFNGKTKLREDYEAGKINGYKGGWLNFLQVGLVYDTRDLEPDPGKGWFIEATHEYSGKYILSDFNFSKDFIQAKYFTKLLPKKFKKLILASRLGISATTGQAPFFEYREVWATEEHFLALGGLRSLRGYKMDRFTAPVIGFGNVELRWRFYDRKILNQHFAFNFVPFFDFGRVWNDIKRVNLSGYKYNEGLGLRVAWNQATIIIFDYAYSKEDSQFFFNFEHIF